MQGMGELVTGKNYTSYMIGDEEDGFRNGILLVVAKAGAGKTLLLERFAECYHNAGYIVIVLADIKNSWEWSFAMFKPEKKYHLKLLGLNRDAKGNPQEPTSKKVKLYHPFTFNIPRYKYPDVNFFTFSMKNLRREDFQFMLERNVETTNMRLMIDASENLNNNDGLYEFIHKIEKTVFKKKDSISSDPLSMGVSTEATTKNIGEIKGHFRTFQNNYFLMPDNFKLNINWKEILSDNQSYHVFSNKFIKDNKTKYFVIFHLLNELVENLHLAKYSICLVIPEVRRMTPYYCDGYKKIMAETIRDNLSTIRNKGRGVATLLDSQVYYDIDPKVRDSATRLLFGSIESLDEIIRICKTLKYDRDKLEDLNDLNDNCFLIKGNESAGAIKMHVPSHCHAEDEYQFEEMYKKYFPEKMKDYKELIDFVAKHKKESENRYKELMKKEIDRERKIKLESHKREADKVKAKEEIIQLKDNMKQKKEEEFEELKNKSFEIFERCKTLGEKIIFRKIAKDLGITHPTVSKIYKMWKVESDKSLKP